MSSGCALTTTPFSSSRRESALLFANAGISVRNLVVGFESWKRTFLVNVPWMAVPFDVISSTWPARTWLRKKGLYGTRTRDGGLVAREPT